MDLSNISSVAEADSVTAADDGNLEPTRGLYVGVSGDVKVDMLDGSTVTLVGLSAGIIHPIQVVRVYSTGTTATDILAFR